MHALRPAVIPHGPHDALAVLHHQHGRVPVGEDPIIACWLVAGTFGDLDPALHLFDLVAGDALLIESGLGE